jgi:Peptidase A4 family
MRSSLVCCVVMATAIVVGLASAAAPALAGGAAAERYAEPNHRIDHSTSTNWSGYAVSGFGPYKSVSSSWRQPAVNCSKTPTAWSAFWVGLDGDTTSTVEQTGTEADCSKGTAIYYAWYEMYPKYPVNYANAVFAGDRFSASVTYSEGGYFQLTLSDLTRGWSHTATQRLKSAKLGSAEAIVEAPSGKGGILPLADFGTAEFGPVSVNGSLLTSSTPGLDPITKVSGSTKSAVPSAISGEGFTDTWYSQ